MTVAGHLLLYTRYVAYKICLLHDLFTATVSLSTQHYVAVQAHHQEHMCVKQFYDNSSFTYLAMYCTVIGCYHLLSQNSSTFM
jgi:hypothetical protein